MSCVSCSTITSDGEQVKQCSLSGECPHLKNHSGVEYINLDLNDFTFNYASDNEKFDTVGDVARSVRETIAKR